MPTEPGWYWWRAAEGGGVEFIGAAWTFGAWVPVGVTLEGHDEPTLFAELPGTPDCPRVADMGGEWGPRISPPSAPGLLPSHAYARRAEEIATLVAAADNGDAEADRACGDEWTAGLARSLRVVAHALAADGDLLELARELRDADDFTAAVGRREPTPDYDEVHDDD